MKNPLLALGTLALLLTPLAAADEQPNAYPSEEQPDVPEETPPCTPIIIFLDPPNVAIDDGCVQDIIDDLFPLHFP